MYFEKFWMYNIAIQALWDQMQVKLGEVVENECERAGIEPDDIIRVDDAEEKEEMVIARDYLAKKALSNEYTDPAKLNATMNEIIKLRDNHSNEVKRELGVDQDNLKTT